MTFQDSETLSVPGLPETLRILGKPFKIVLLPDDDDDGNSGLMDLSKQEISIRLYPALEQLQDTSLHETIHAIEKSLSLDMSEEQVHQLAVALLCVLKDNKKYARWLLKESV